MPPYLVLLFAIAAEVTATTALKSSDGFRNVWPSVIVVIGYSLSFYFLSITLRSIPVGVAYAIWSGVGTVVIVCLGWLVHGQRLDSYALAGITFISAGMIMLNLLSSSGKH
ncbi:DMT family transporter [Sinorhizobium meliloti]|uniref:DMT family transporter n=1 Tax=Rhizobium meliloti TaxID=382 RepID=UPI003F191247